MENFLVILEGRGGEKLFSGEVNSLSIDEELLIRKSIEFYDDPEPCFIHRTAVMKRLFAEVDDYFGNLGISTEEERSWAELPEYIREILQIQGAEIVKVKALRR